MHKSIAIIGCGYIGMDVAALWSQRGHHVTATTRSPERLPELSRVAQKGIVIKGEDEEGLIPLVAGNDILLVSIAADSLEQYESAYLQTAKMFRHLALEMEMPRQLIYLGSTSVYGDHEGLWVDEQSPLKAKSDAAKILMETEKTYLSLDELGWTVCVLRLAEIYGPGRELSKRIKQLEGHVLPGNGEQYTNMIHKEDCVSAIDYAMRHHLEGIFNLADDDHPTRKSLYDSVCHQFDLPSVRWDPHLTGLHTGNKRVSTHKIAAEGFVFKHPHRVIS
jgi:nucleoside-diphosphate-sugar epimerase